MLRCRLAGRRSYRRTVALLRKMETRAWFKHLWQEQSTFFVPSITQQQLAETSVQKLLQPSAMGSVSDLLVCHSDDSISSSELKALEEMIRTSQPAVRR